MEKDKKLYLLPIFLLLAIVPVIVFYRPVPLDGITYQAWPVSQENADFFSYYKVRMLLIFTVISFGSFIYYVYKRNEIKKTIYYIPLLGYMFFIFLSGILSNYKPVSLFGVADRYEGMYVLLAYCMLTILVYNMVNNEFDIKIILSGLFISTLIISLIGIFQYFGEIGGVNTDFFRSYTGKLMILPQKFHGMADKLEFRFGKHTIYTTLYNTNYVGSFMVMILFVSLSITLYLKNMKYKIMGGLFTLLVFSNFIGCRSRAGFLGGIFAISLFLICYLINTIFKILKSEVNVKKILMRYIDLALLFVLAFLIMIGLNYYSGGSLFGQFTSLKRDIKITTEITEITEAEKIYKSLVVKNIDLKSDKIVVDFNDNKMLKIEYDINGGDGTIKFFKEGNEKMNMEYFKDGKIEIKDEVYGKINIKLRRIKFKENIHQAINMNLNGTNFDFFLTLDGFRIIDAKAENLILPREIPRLKILDGKERIGSSRGYIYSRSIPILKETLFIGYGPDTYSIVFPQDDYIGKVIGYGTPNKVVDKPHNMYLQFGINTGVISMILNILMFAYYFFTSLMLYIKNREQNFYYAVGLGLFTGITGYFVAGLFNDSLVSVAPVFWILFGLGIAVNQIIKRDSPSGK